MSSRGSGNRRKKNRRKGAGPKPNGEEKEDPIEEKVDPTEIARKLLDAAKANDLDLVKQLLQQGADVDGRVAPAPEPPASTGSGLNTALMPWLKPQQKKQPKAKPKAPPPPLCPPLIAAAAANAVPVVQHLLSLGAFIEMRDENGQTALIHAAASGALQALQVLLDAGANANATDFNGGSALHAACSEKQRESLRLLLELKQLDVEHPNIAGRTPLHVACSAPFLEGVRLLLAHGASRSPVDAEGALPLTLLNNTLRPNEDLSEEALKATREEALAAIVLLAKDHPYLVDVFAEVTDSGARYAVVEAVGVNQIVRAMFDLMVSANNTLETSQMNEILVSAAGSVKRSRKPLDLTMENFKALISLLMSDGNVAAFQSWSSLLLQPQNVGYTRMDHMDVIAWALRKSGRIVLFSQSPNCDYAFDFFRFFLELYLKLFINNQHHAKGRALSQRSAYRKPEPEPAAAMFLASASVSALSAASAPAPSPSPCTASANASTPAPSASSSTPSPPGPANGPALSAPAVDSSGVPSAPFELELLDRAECAHALDSFWPIVRLGLFDIDEHINEGESFALLVHSLFCWLQVFPELEPFFASDRVYPTPPRYIEAVSVIRVSPPAGKPRPSALSDAARASLLPRAPLDVDAVWIRSLQKRSDPAHGPISVELAPGPAPTPTAPTGSPAAPSPSEPPSLSHPAPLSVELIFEDSKLPALSPSDYGDEHEALESSPRGHNPAPADPAKHPQSSGSKRFNVNVLYEFYMRKLAVSSAFVAVFESLRDQLEHLQASDDEFPFKYFPFLMRVEGMVDLATKVRHMCAAVSRGQDDEEFQLQINRLGVTKDNKKSLGSSRVAPRERDDDEDDEDEDEDDEDDEDADEDDDDFPEEDDGSDDDSVDSDDSDPEAVALRQSRVAERRAQHQQRQRQRLQQSAQPAPRPAASESEPARAGPAEAKEREEKVDAAAPAAASAAAQRSFAQDLREREEMMEFLMNQLVSAPPGALYHISVSFVGEPGVGDGPLRELFDFLSVELFSEHSKCFEPSPDMHHYHLKPARGNPDQALNYYRMAGRVLALSVTHKVPLGVSISAPLVKTLLGRELVWEDLEGFDEDLFKSMKRLLAEPIPAHQPEDEALTFVATVRRADGRMADQELCRGGASMRVTEENKARYVELLAQARMAKPITAELRALAQGFHDLLPPRVTEIISAAELSLLIHGPRELDLSDLKAHITYDGGYHVDTPLIQWFWEVVDEMSNEEQRALLRFWSGTPVPPLHGFHPKFNEYGETWCINKSTDPTDSLPRSSTCSYLLRLPPYETKQVLKDKLLKAVVLGSLGYTTQ